MWDFVFSVTYKSVLVERAWLLFLLILMQKFGLFHGVGGLKSVNDSGSLSVVVNINKWYDFLQLAKGLEE